MRTRYLGLAALVLALAACDDDEQQAGNATDATPEVVQEEVVTDEPATAMTEEEPAIEPEGTAGMTETDDAQPSDTQTAAVPSETETLLGRWESGDPVAVVEYREDGTMSYEVEGQASEGRWEEDGTTMTLIIEGADGETQTVACEFQVQGDELRFTEGDPQCDEMVFNRAS